MITRRISMTGFALLCFLGGLGISTSVADDFQVNTYYEGNQQAPAISLGANGEMVVVWSSYGSLGGDSSFESIQARRFSSDGTMTGGEFQVNSWTTGTQFRPDVAVAPGGDSIVVWQSAESPGSDSSSFSVQGRRFASNGSPIGNDFQVNSYTTSYQGAPSIGIDTDGDFVVVWQSDGSYGTDNDTGSVQAQLFAADGSAVGGQVQINTFTTGIQDRPTVAMSADGSFVVSWSVFDFGGLGYAIQGQRLAANGAAIGGEFQVNTITEGVVYPEVAVDDAGDFVVVWTSRASSGTDSSYASIQGQRFASDGTPSGGEFQVNTWTTSYQYDPAVAMEPDGDFVIAWYGFGSYGTDSSAHVVHGQRHAADGAAVGSEFQVNTYTTNSQWGPAVVVDDSGTATIVWSSNGSTGHDPEGSSIQIGRFVSATIIFADGFESGDTSEWSESLKILWREP